MPFGAALGPGPIGGYLGGNALVTAQFGLYALAAVGLAPLLVPALRGRVRMLAAVATVLAVAGALIGAVPAGGATTAAVLSGIFGQAHVLSAGTWLGGLGLLAGLATASRGLPAGDAWASVWSRFSMLAMASVGLLLVSGLWLLWMHVGTPAQLVTTTYGQFLLVKLILVLAMLIAGALNQLALLPRIARVRRAEGDGPTLLRLTLQHFPRVVAAEALLGLGVLVILPFISGSARKQAGETGSPEIDGSVLLIGALFVAMLVVSFVAAARLGDRMARRGGTAETA